MMSQPPGLVHRVLGIEPYFQRPEQGPPAYIEFRVGADEDELGLIDRRYAPPNGSRDPGGAIIYWQVDDVAAAVSRLIELGATEYQPVTAQGTAGFITASVVDPFGNILGLMYNPTSWRCSRANAPDAVVRLGTCCYTFFTPHCFQRRLLKS